MIKLTEINKSCLMERVLAFGLLFCTISSLIYRVYRFDWFNIIAALVSSVIIVLILKHFGWFFNEDPTSQKLRGASMGPARNATHSVAGGAAYAWIGLSGVLTLAVLSVLWNFRSTASIVTPWQLVPAWLFVLYFVTVVAVFISSRLSALSFWFFALGSFLVIPIIYSLGYGYDFFIHEASLREIILRGEILPKTNFYFGQYSLILLVQKILQVPYSLLHLWLVPFLSAIFLPWVVIKNYKNNSERLGWLLILMFPFGFLTFTTPQNFGLLLLLAEIILLSKPTKENLLMSGFLVLFNLTIHPISAIPGLTLLALLWLEHLKIRGRLVFFLSTLLPIAIPFLLLLTGAAHWTGFRAATGLFPVIPFSLPDSENIFLNLTYGYYNNLSILAVLLLTAALLANYRKLGDLIANVGLSLGLLGAVVVMQFIELRNVIDYEQADYARRLLLIAFFVVLPIIAKLLTGFVRRVLAQSRIEQAVWLVFAAGLLTMSFYLSYPRHDNYFNSRGLSTSLADLEAVRYIEAEAKGASYVVLANQQVSAASLKEFGFAHYYRDNFYYPIPTTNPLYDYYLEMVYQRPVRETAVRAKESAGVDRVYFVLNKYWQDFPKLLEEAKLAAKNYQSFDNGSVYVFSY